MISPELQLKQTDAGIVVRLHIVPRAKRCEIAGVHNGALKIKVAAPPVDDAANRALIDFLSGLLELPKSSLKITAGSRSRDKTLHIGGVSCADFLVRISKLEIRR